MSRRQNFQNEFDQVNYETENELNPRQWREKNLWLRAPGKHSSYDIRRDFWGDFPENRTANRETIRPSQKRRSNRRNDIEGSETRRKRAGSAHFEKYAEEGNRFINEVANELGINDRRQALRVTKAVLHAVRDRLPATDSIEFAQGLPLVLKGVYFDQYDISKTPVSIKSSEEFIDFIREKDRFGAINDFQSPREVVSCLRTVFRVLEHRLDRGQVEQIAAQLPKDIVRLIGINRPYMLAD